MPRTFSSLSLLLNSKKDVYSFAQLIAYCWDPCITTTRFRSEQAFGELYTQVEALRRQTPVALSSLLQALLNLVRA